MPTQNFLVTPKIYASKEKRFVNFIIDIAGYYMFTILFGVVIGAFSLIGIDEPLIYISNISKLEDYFLGFIIGFTYFFLFESVFQKSPGKFITNTIVVLEDGSKPTNKDILLRSLCRYIPFDAFSFLGDQGRGWHDSISETYVVDVVKFNAQKTAEIELDLIGTSAE